MTPRQLLRLAFGLIAAVILVVAGWAMAGIGSAAGYTIEAQFYQAMGWASTGVGMFRGGCDPARQPPIGLSAHRPDAQALSRVSGNAASGPDSMPSLRQCPNWRTSARHRLKPPLSRLGEPSCYHDGRRRCWGSRRLQRLRGEQRRVGVLGRGLDHDDLRLSVPLTPL